MYPFQICKRLHIPTSLQLGNALASCVMFLFRFARVGMRNGFEPLIDLIAKTMSYDRRTGGHFLPLRARTYNFDFSRSTEAR